MEALITGLHNWFWDSNIWLIPGISWEDLTPTPENGFPKTSDLVLMMIILTGAFLVLKYLVLEPFIIKPFGRAIGLKDQIVKKPPHRKEFESLFQRFKNIKIPQNEMTNVAQTTGCSERQIERWLRQRAHSERPTNMFKFCDCCWNLLYYLFYCFYGAYALYDKSWLWDIKLCWSKYPFQAVTNDIWWYYMISLGYYTMMSLSFMFQHKRKDSLQMLLHHLVTIGLIMLSFAVNMVRLGSLILLVHECADIPLLIAKICGYAGYPAAMDYIFVIFILLWTATRLYLFPFWIMKNAMFEAHLILDTMAPVYYIFNALLIMLLLFHLIWTFFIVQIIVKKLRTRETKDLRSDDDDFSDELEDETFTPNNKQKQI